MAGADLVVCTGGYNTAVQVLRYARRALMIPRVLHRQEQYLRASRLAELGLVRMLRPEQATPSRLREEVRALLDNPSEPLTEARAQGVFRFDGAAVLAEFCASLIATRRQAAEAANE